MLDDAYLFKTGEVLSLSVKGREQKREGRGGEEEYLFIEEIKLFKNDKYKSVLPHF